MTYDELYSVIRRSVSGNKPNKDDGHINKALINRLVLSARAFVLMKYTKSGRTFEHTLVQKLTNVKLLPASVQDLATFAGTTVASRVNSENDAAYINDLYYYDLPSEFLQWGNRRAIHSITDIDQMVHCQVIEEGSVRVNDDPLFPGKMPMAWVNRKRLFVRVNRLATLLNAINLTTGQFEIDKTTWPTGVDLVTLDSSSVPQPMPAKFVNISGVFYNPIAAASYNTSGTVNPDISGVDLNIPYEFLDMLVQQVITTYLEKMENTMQETTLDGKTEKQPSQPPQ